MVTGWSCNGDATRGHIQKLVYKVRGTCTKIGLHGHNIVMVIAIIHPYMTNRSRTTLKS